MAGLKALGLGQLAAGAATALAVIVGGGVWWSTQQPVAPAPEPAAEAAPEPVATDSAAPETVAPEPAAPEPVAAESAAPEPAAPEPAATEPVAAESAATEPATTEVVVAEPAAVAEKSPSFDVVRVDPDGNALIAGQAAAGSAVSVRIDQTEVFSTSADATGKFVAMFAVPPAGVPRTVTLVMLMENGTEMAGTDSVILAPTAAKPGVVAEAAEPAATELAATEPAATEPAATEPAATETAATETAAETAATTTAATDPAATDPAAVAEPAAPAVLLADETGLKVLQPAGDAIAQNVVIDTISYDRSGSVVLAGRGAGDSALQIYLDNQPLAAIAIAADGTWSTPLPAIQPGIHTLRVDQIDAAGKVTSRYETPFKREDPAALASLGDEPAPAETVVAEAVTAEPAPAEPAPAEPAPFGVAQAVTATEPVAEAVAEPVGEPAAEVAAPEPAAETAAPEPAAEPTAKPAVKETAAEPASTEAAPEPPAPEPAAAESAAPEPPAPEATAPEATAPEATAPEPAAPETAAPETAAPETAATETVVAKAEEPAPAPDAAEAPAAPEPVATADSAVAPDPAATEPVVTAGAAEVAQPTAEPAPEPVSEGPRVTIVTVQPGFTLWQIASEAYGKGVMYVQVWDANKDKIRDPDLIYPGQVFMVPEPPTTDGN